MKTAHAEHECPKFCHTCPLLNGGVMPGCTGQACRGDWFDDMWACTCPENKGLFVTENVVAASEHAR